jgi:hypothetical protein
MSVNKRDKRRSLRARVRPARASVWDRVGPRFTFSLLEQSAALRCQFQRESVSSGAGLREDLETAILSPVWRLPDL